MLSINPVVFSAGAVCIRWYGVMAALGLCAAYAVLQMRATKYGFSKDKVADAVFWMAISGFIGARILYVIRYWNQIFANDFMEIFRVYNGGLVFLGGFALATIIGYLICRRNKWELGAFTDFIAPALPLGHAFGRMGCLLNGCCYGFQYDGPLSFHYEHVSFSTFPLQGIAFLLNLLLGGILLLLEKRSILKHRLFLLYVVVYAIGRFTLECGRGDYPSEQLLCSMTPAQITCLWLLPLTVALWLFIHFKFSKK